MKQFLNKTEFFDTDSQIIKSIIDKLQLDGLSEKEKAIKIFYYVRDSIRYSVKPVNLEKETYIASKTLSKDISFCIPKAIALGTLARAINIPSRLHFVDFINHRLSASLEKLWGTKIMAAHCYTELFIGERWVKATAALDKNTSDKHNFITVEFDGENDALLHPVDRAGNPHAEYIKDHGTFADLSLDFVSKVFKQAYGELSNELIKRNFESSAPTFT